MSALFWGGILLFISSIAVLLLDLYRCYNNACDFGHAYELLDGLYFVALISFIGGFITAYIIKINSAKR